VARIGKAGKSRKQENMSIIHPIPDPGTRYGRWQVIGGERHTSATTRIRQTLCVCECGTKRWVAIIALRRGSSKSCGCRVKERHAAFMKRKAALPKSFSQ
jgi:hypothetical protein